MGIFDSYLDDIQKEFRRVTDGIDAMQNGAQSGAQKIVGAIDDLEKKVTNLPTEEDIKKKLKNKVKTTTKTMNDKNKLTKK
jgi:hypothetical protein